VSVVITTYNRAHLIGQTLDSVLAQTYRDFEIIVVDDGSTDETPAVLAGYGESILVLRQQNAGQPEARKAGIRAAQGDFVAFVDSDDLWLPTKLDKQMARLSESKDLAWIYCDAEVFDSSISKVLYHFGQINPPHRGWVARQLLLRDFIPSPTPVIRRDVFEQIGYLQASDWSRHGEDWDMWLRIAAHHAVEYIPEVLARYRVHSGAMTQREDISAVHEDRTGVIERAVAFAPQVYGRMRKQALAALCLHTGRRLALAGNAREAQAMFRRAMRLTPGSTTAYAHWLASLTGQSALQGIARLMFWLRGIWNGARRASADWHKG
jgi:glycosyltransferase involved in cell wall biosynthesis